MINIPNPKLPKKFAILIKSKVKKTTIIKNNMIDSITKGFFKLGWDIRSSVEKVKNKVCNRESHESNLKPEFNIKKNPKTNKYKVIFLTTFCIFPF